MIALLAAAALVPAAQGALVIEDISGIRALLTAAGQHSPSVSPASIGQSLADRVGVDLLAEPQSWGLAKGQRVVAFSRGAIGFSAAIANPRAASTALDAWKAGKPGRVGRIAGKRLYTASGNGAAAMLTALQKPQPLPDIFAGSASGPAWLFLALTEPLRATVLRIDASASGLVATGTVTASDVILAGQAPDGCAGTPVACIRAGLGPAGRGALQVALARLGAPAQPGVRQASRVEERLNTLDPRRLDALRPTATFDAPASNGPALAGFLDLAQIDQALARLNPIDALQSNSAAGALAARLVYGELLRSAGPLSIRGDPLPGGAAHVELRLPVK